MRIIIVVAATVTALTCSFAEDAPAPPADLVTEVVKAKAMEFSRALVALKLEDVKLSRATPIDNDRLALIRAQEAAINQELLHMAVDPLQFKLKQALKNYSEGNRVIIELRQEIERTTVAILGDAPDK